MQKILFLSFLFINLISHGQSSVPNNSKLELKEIMKGNEFIGHQPENAHWAISGNSILFDWNPDKNIGNSSYRIDALSKEKKPIKETSATLPIAFDRSQQQFETQYSIVEGALISINKKTLTEKIILQASIPVRNVIRVNDPRLVYFQQGNNLYQYNELKGSILQITNFMQGEEKIAPKDSTLLMQQSTELFQYIRDQNERKNWNKKQNEPKYKFPEPYYFGKANIDNLQISRDSKIVSFRLTYDVDEKSTEVTQHITSDGFTKQMSARGKVSDQDATHKLGMYNIAEDSVYFIDFSTLTDIRKKPDYMMDNDPFDSDRKIIMHSLHFSSLTQEAVCDIRSYDNKDRWIILIDLRTGKFRELEKQHDNAWIGGPGISSWNMEEGTLGWLKDNKTIYFQSEETGYSHIYTLNIQTGLKSALTSGKWEVYEVILSNDGRKLFITANLTHPGDRGFYHLDIASKKLLPIHTKSGYHEVSISPDEKQLAVRYSYKNKPWELYTSANVGNSKLIQLTNSTTPEFKAYQWREPEVITFTGSDGVEVFARLYKPTVETKNSAAVIFVHGAGYLQNAHNYWSTYYREYMFHNMLTDNGFTVLDIDYRASEGYGRDYRTAIYRHMGGRDLQDQLDGKKFLTEKLGIDPDRVGIYGGSYGGFITLMGMLTSPDEFQCGAALRSVTDWAHYNHEYTSNILNYPGTDPEAYQKSSPIYFANGLKNKLLMLHGMVDDNVQFQDVVRLSQKFIELGKENWELAVFPVEAHGFKESYSWNDEYRRIYELFVNELLLNKTK